MTLEQKKIKLAEKLGWTDIKVRNTLVCRGLTGKIPNDSQVLPIPNWPEDLNACHEAESWLIDNYRSKYFRLENIFLNEIEFPTHATALQRFNALYTVLVGDGEEEG